ncbi:class I SAM-dependent methyltransferase [Modestobacter roseus]|uniref:Methyltransferase family protein n=1 Tax=Modestobacter roseus TaxID=1181884 RepID=A0A562IQX3_9ACTN|nr:class I SAM-dependent methyltransferase [Modestobacter roseus]MQA35170.1 methyltransferase domain-containing protein [Modestobacter roseus]TWH72984.1 methyltransferase family protein [Modestobacter roseus]
MTEQHAHAFDRAYWEEHWHQRAAGEGSTGPAASPHLAPSPHLARELGDLPPGTALDAGCGEGAEARWLAERGWQVTAVDISATALERAAARAGGERVQWVEADLADWAPDGQFDLVTTHYAHPAGPQLDFYARIAEWVAPGGTLLIVGHLHGHTAHVDGEHPPAEASVTAAAVTARLDRAAWVVVTATEGPRTLTAPSGRAVTLHDVVVRATRRG